MRLAKSALTWLKKIKFVKALSRLVYRTGLINAWIRRPVLLYAHRSAGIRIVEREELLKSGDSQIFKFSQGEVVNVCPPFNLDQIPLNERNALPPIMRNKSVAALIEQPFIAIIESAELVGPTAIAFNQEGNIIFDSVMTRFRTILPESAIPASALITKLRSHPIEQEFDLACSLAFCWNKNYHHWLVDTLTRLEGLEWYQQHTGRKPLLIFDSDLSTGQRDSLEFLGYKSDSYIRWSYDRCRVKQLVLPSFRRDERVSGLSCAWLRDRIAKQLSKRELTNHNFSKRIIISRSKAAFRRIVNESELEAALAPLGFVSYSLESMSFADQAQLFSNSEVIISPHGAGLTNMLFSVNNPLIIELFGPRNIHNNVDFFALANSLEFPYALLKCQAAPGDFRNEDCNMIVNPKVVLELLDQLSIR